MVITMYPDMLSAHLIGRLLPEINNHWHIRNLILQCDNEGFEHNCLVPMKHYLNSPGMHTLNQSRLGTQVALCTIFSILLTFLGKYCNAHMLHASGVYYSFMISRQMGKMMDLQKCQQNRENRTQWRWGICLFNGKKRVPLLWFWKIHPPRYSGPKLRYGHHCCCYVCQVSKSEI